jgi:hypothetical protein
MALNCIIVLANINIIFCCHGHVMFGLRGV